MGFFVDTIQQAITAAAQSLFVKGGKPKQLQPSPAVSPPGVSDSASTGSDSKSPVMSTPQRFAEIFMMNNYDEEFFSSDDEKKLKAFNKRVATLKTELTTNYPTLTASDILKTAQATVENQFQDFNVLVKAAASEASRAEAERAEAARVEAARVAEAAAALQTETGEFREKFPNTPLTHTINFIMAQGLSEIETMDDLNQLKLYFDAAKSLVDLVTTSSKKLLETINYPTKEIFENAILAANAALNYKEVKIENAISAASVALNYEAVEIENSADQIASEPVEKSSNPVEESIDQLTRKLEDAKQVFDAAAEVHKNAITAEIARLAAEEQARLAAEEQARLAAEEQARLAAIATATTKRATALENTPIFLVGSNLAKKQAASDMRFTFFKAPENIINAKKLAMKADIAANSPIIDTKEQAHRKLDAIGKNLEYLKEIYAARDTAGHQYHGISKLFCLFPVQAAYKSAAKKHAEVTRMLAEITRLHDKLDGVENNNDAWDSTNASSQDRNSRLSALSGELTTLMTKNEVIKTALEPAPAAQAL